jgi:pimeloyl-ACP methyl ester carboxylesterase
MDITLSYVEKGSGTPFVMLHGNSESNRYFCSQIDFFSNYYRVIAPDTRGHGKSPRGKAPFTLAQFAEDLKEFLDDLGIEKAIILGFSDGGNIALLFALKYPQYVEKLILNGADLSPEGVKPIVQIPIELGFSIAGFFSRFDKKAVAKKEMLGLMVGQPNIQTEELESITAPTLVIAGTKDMIKEKHTVSICRAIPNSALSIIKGNHFCARDNSDKFNRVVKDFLEA